MTAIVNTRQQRQVRLKKLLQTTPSLSPFYLLDDFINNQPSDEFVWVLTESFRAVVKTYKRRSNKIYKSELTKIR